MNGGFWHEQTFPSPKTNDRIWVGSSWEDGSGAGSKLTSVGFSDTLAPAHFHVLLSLRSEQRIGDFVDRQLQ